MTVALLTPSTALMSDALGRRRERGGAGGRPVAAAGGAADGCASGGQRWPGKSLLPSHFPASCTPGHDLLTS